MKNSGKLAIDISKAVLNNNLELENKLKIDFDDLKKQKDILINESKIPNRSTKTYI